MSKAQEILGDQTIYVKKGRLNGLGFEPCFNSFFDFYLSTKYITPPLLQLEDVTFFLYLRKNLNAQNPRWKMPSTRHIKQKFAIGYPKLYAMLDRLDAAQLLKKESGVGRGKVGQNVVNAYILSDPIQTLEEFLIVASEGLLGRLPREEYAQPPCTQNESTPESEMGAPPAPILGELKQTSNNQTVESYEDNHTFDSELDKLWDAVMTNLKPHVPSATFHAFLQDLSLVSFEDGAVVIGTRRPWVQQWVEEQMRNRIRKALELELRIRGDSRKVDMVRCVVLTEE